jgi:competence protein ComGC
MYIIIFLLLIVILVFMYFLSNNIKKNQNKINICDSDVMALRERVQSLTNKVNSMEEYFNKGMVEKKQGRPVNDESFTNILEKLSSMNGDLEDYDEEEDEEDDDSEDDDDSDDSDDDEDGDDDESGEDESDDDGEDGDVEQKDDDEQRAQQVLPDPRPRRALAARYRALIAHLPRARRSPRARRARATQVPTQ